jgi:hypothetical protein
MRLLPSIALAILLPVSANAARAVMEGISASNNTVFVDTTTKRVHLSTQAYGDGVPTVSLYTTSNVVVGDSNACVLYATGTIKCLKIEGSIDYSTITAALNAKLSSVTINASLLNPEASLSLPLRVNSSSVAIKNASNFVLNSEIDSSSVAKFGSHGSSMTFTATGDNTFSLTTSSGIHIAAGTLYLEDGGIRWPNGVYQTSMTAGGGSGGSSVLVKTTTHTLTNTISANYGIACDNSIPQISEGVLLASATVTAASATNKFRIYVNGMLSSNGADFSVCAVFKDTTANAVAGSGRCNFISGANQIQVMTIIVEDVAGDTSSHLYSVRCGMGGGGLLEVNYTDGGRKLGGNAAFSVFVDEITP